MEDMQRFEGVGRDADRNSISHIMSSPVYGNT
jgi:hypothetical protein